MGCGASWAAEQAEAKAALEAHIKSEKFNKQYIEEDIVRTLTKEEIHLLVTRLIIHQLGGFAEYFEKSSSAQYDLFMDMSEKAQKRFIAHWADRLGFEIEPTKKIKALQEKLKELQTFLLTRDDK